MNKLFLFTSFIVVFGILSCKDKGETAKPSEIEISFYNPEPLKVDLTGNQPPIKGYVRSENGLVSISAYMLKSDGSISLVETIELEGVTEYDFEYSVAYFSSFKGLRLDVTDQNDQSDSKVLDIVYEQQQPLDAQPITDNDAFPGAEGFGRYTTGGRGGRVLVVESLEDSDDKGTLRWAINQTGARTVVFKVSGTIWLQKSLIIKNDNLTIAGQTAPGDGICIAGNYLQLNDNLDNVIIRYLRFRNARGIDEYDAAWGRNASNIIIDHCSFSWGNDEVASFYDNRNFTMQWCIISESFYNSTHPKGKHGYGGIWGGMGATFHHNLLAHHTSRNPRFCGARYHEATRDQEIVDYRNNVLYNWGGNSAYGGEMGQHNMVNNYYKSGPATSSSKRNRIVEVSSADSKWFIEGNYVHGYSDISADNWSGGVHGASSSEVVRANTPFENGQINTQTAVEAYVDVLKKAGCSIKRDVNDARLVNEVSLGTATYGGSYGSARGIIDSENDTEGFPVLEQYDEIKDIDYDGMDDDWELANGLDPTNPKDHQGNDLDTLYTNLEVYINSLTK